MPEFALQWTDLLDLGAGQRKKSRSDQATTSGHQGCWVKFKGTAASSCEALVFVREHYLSVELRRTALVISWVSQNPPDLAAFAEFYSLAAPVPSARNQYVAGRRHAGQIVSFCRFDTELSPLPSITDPSHPVRPAIDFLEQVTLDSYHLGDGISFEHTYEFEEDAQIRCSSKKFEFYLADYRALIARRPYLKSEDLDENGRWWVSTLILPNNYVNMTEAFEGTRSLAAMLLAECFVNTKLFLVLLRSVLHLKYKFEDPIWLESVMSFQDGLDYLREYPHDSHSGKSGAALCRESGGPTSIA